MSQNIRLIEYSRLPCSSTDASDAPICQRRIVSTSIEGDTLRLVMTTVLNCCSGIKGRAEFRAGAIFLYAEYPDSVPVIDEKGDTIGWEEPAACDCECCMTMQFTLQGLDSDNHLVFLNGWPMKLHSNRYEISFLVHGLDTLLRSDSLGFQYSYSFFDSGELRMIRKFRGLWNEWHIYYKGGGLQSVRYYYKFYDNAAIREYDQNGEMIQCIDNLIVPESD
jgi:hypothetical protein